MGQKKNLAAALFFCFLLVFLCSPVSAIQRVSFADPDTVTHKDVYMYYANGSLIGQYNTTSTGIAIPNDTEGDVLLVLKPQYTTPMDDPGVWLSSFLSWTQTNAIALIFAMAILGILVKKW